MENLLILQKFESAPLLQPVQGRTGMTLSHETLLLKNAARIFPFERQHSLETCINSAITITIDLSRLITMGACGNYIQTARILR